MDKVKNIMSLTLIAVLIGMLVFYLDPRVNEFAGFLIAVDFVYVLGIVSYIVFSTLTWAISREDNKREKEEYVKCLESKVKSLESKLEEIKEDKKSEEWRSLENTDNKKHVFTIETNWGTLHVSTKYRRSDIVSHRIEEFLDNTYMGYSKVYYGNPGIIYKVSEYISRDSLLSMLEYISRIEDTVVMLRLDHDRDIL